MAHNDLGHPSGSLLAAVASAVLLLFGSRSGKLVTAPSRGEFEEMERQLILENSRTKSCPTKDKPSLLVPPAIHAHIYTHTYMHACIHGIHA